MIFLNERLFLAFIGGSLESPWWLLLAFWPKILTGSRDLWIVLCHSMNAGSVVGIPWGGGDTQTLPYVKEFVWTLGAHTISWVIACAQAQSLAPLCSEVVGTVNQMFFLFTFWHNTSIYSWVQAFMPGLHPQFRGGGTLNQLNLWKFHNGGSSLVLPTSACTHYSPESMQITSLPIIHSI